MDMMNASDDFDNSEDEDESADSEDEDEDTPTPLEARWEARKFGCWHRESFNVEWIHLSKHPKTGIKLVLGTSA